MRDTLGPLFSDTAFADLYAHQGPSGISPARLATITLLQFHEDLSDEETLRLIMRPGVSTADQVSSVSGRGVGLDAVERTIHGLGGEVRILSEIGKSTAYARVFAEALESGRRVANGVRFFLQFGSQEVEEYARKRGYLEVFSRAGATVIHPGCGACIGCGPGVSERGDQVTVSAINRNYKGRSGPGKLWLASPLTVAASAFTGRITAYTPGMFARQRAGLVTA